MGNINPSGKGMNGNVYNSNGLSPTITTNKGEGIKIAIPVIAPDRKEKRQNGRRLKEENDPMFTLTAQDRHGVLIKEANKKGYSEAHCGDSINLEQPNSQTRRGRVGKGKANTLTTQPNQGTLQNGRIRKLTPRECWRLQDFTDKQFNIAQSLVSESQLYKQAGNAVTVGVVQAIAEKIEIN